MLIFTPTHPHTDTHTILTYWNSYTDTHILPLILPLSDSQSHNQAHLVTIIYSRSHAHNHKLTLTYPHLHTHTHILTYLYSQTQDSCNRRWHLWKTANVELVNGRDLNRRWTLELVLANNPSKSLKQLNSAQSKLPVEPAKWPLLKAFKKIKIMPFTDEFVEIFGGASADMCAEIF